jgi:hypothetical protein
MDNNKKDWTPAERERFERILCGLLYYMQYSDIEQTIKYTQITINKLDEHYKNTSHEPTN